MARLEKGELWIFRDRRKDFEEETGGCLSSALHKRILTRGYSFGDEVAGALGQSGSTRISWDELISTRR